MNEQHHEMILGMIHATGMQGWYCPTCGRRILFLLPPSSEMVVVERGNPDAHHSGSSGGLSIGTVESIERDEESEQTSGERLRPWIKALEQIDLNW